MTDKEKCPFCESRFRSKYATEIGYYCGTIGPDDKLIWCDGENEVQP